MEEHFLLNSKTARELYKSCAELPVIDYHNHLSVGEIAENRRFETLYDLWIAPDPYKHRAMRMCGIPERCITGEASPEEKFEAWCKIFPKLAGNPLYQWSLMELQDILEIRDIPGADTHKAIRMHADAYLARSRVSPGSILERYRVEYLSPCMSLTEDPGQCKTDTRVNPSLRGDSIVSPDGKFLEKLEELTGVRIVDADTYFRAVTLRLDAFAAAGCRFADHGLDDGFRYYGEDGKNGERFRLLLEKESRESGKADPSGYERTEAAKEAREAQGKKETGEETGREGLSGEDREKLASAILRYLGGEYAKRGMVLQLHMGARRRTSTRLRRLAGPAGGYAAMGNGADMMSLAEFLDDMEKSETGLPRVILFALNPSDHAMLATISGSYARDGVSGLITQGPAWWWCDHGHGIRSVLENTAVYGLLSNFVGMTTDSRSFLSFVRHDYFRRVLCDWMAEKVSRQELPRSPELLEDLLYDLCYGNAKRIIERVSLGT